MSPAFSWAKPQVAAAVCILASVAGMGLSTYLTVVHYANAIPACPAGGAINCEAVLASSYGVIAGTSVPTSAAGIVWFAVSLVLWTRPLPRLQLAWSVTGMVTVLYLIYVEIVALGAICLWCTAAHVLVVAIFILALTAPRS